MVHGSGPRQRRSPTGQQYERHTQRSVADATVPMLTTTAARSPKEVSLEQEHGGAPHHVCHAGSGNSRPPALRSRGSHSQQPHSVVPRVRVVGQRCRTRVLRRCGPTSRPANDHLYHHPDFRLANCISYEILWGCDGRRRCRLISAERLRLSPERREDSDGRSPLGWRATAPTSSSRAAGRRHARRRRRNCRS